jgi:hypothetical protein
MPLSLNETPGELKRFRKVSWSFQSTFETPLKNLDPFVSTIIDALEPVQAARITLSQVVFEPENVNEFLQGHGLALPKDKSLENWTLEAKGSKDIRAMLQAVLSDSIDFTFVPMPKPFVIFADHDEFTTFLAMRRSNLNRIIAPLTALKMAPIAGYTRRL